MRHALVDKRVAGIIRWLERLKQSYSSGAMESALMEAECARADLEILRADVWNKISTKPREVQRNKIFMSIMNFARIAVLTSIIVLLTGFPISKELPAKVIEEDKTQLVLAEPIQIIYEEPKLAKVSTQTQLETPVKRDNKVKSKVEIQKPQKNVAPLKSDKPDKPAVPQKKVAYEELFSLMQTGQKALKNNSSVVKIK